MPNNQPNTQPPPKKGASTMFNRPFVQNLPDIFHVTAVQVATVWTEPDSARDMDQPAISNPTDIDFWLSSLSNTQKLALCNDNRVQTQTLYGEAVLVTETKGNWAQITIPSQPSKKNEDGYPGWVPLDQLKQVHKKDWIRPETAAVIEKMVWLENESGEPTIKLSYMTCLPVLSIEKENDRVQVLTPDGPGFLPKEAVEIFPTEEGSIFGDGKAIIEAGKQFLGLDYLWGGMSSFGYDCSGFSYAMHKANGYQISRDATDQAEHGKEIPLHELLPGDLLFFAYQEGKGRIHHVGFYCGDGKMMHSPQTGKQIEIISLEGTTYEKELCRARRYWIPGGV